MSPRRILGLILLLFLMPVCIMAAFGPEVLLGPRPEPESAGVVRSVRLRDGATEAVSITPNIVGPGERFDIALTFEAGTGGYFTLQHFECGTESSLWPVRRHHWSVHNPAPRNGLYPRDVSPIPATLVYENVEIPNRRLFSDHEVALLVGTEITRPLVDQRTRRLHYETYWERYEVTLHLGHGTVTPSGWLHFHPYNRQTWGLLALACLPIVYALIYAKPRIRRRYLPDAILPPDPKTPT